jgi:predicted outer membrane repeat protein
MHGPITTGEHKDILISENTSNTIGGAVMCGFMLMLMIDEGVSILRQHL